MLAEHTSAQAALDALPGIASAAGVKDYAPASRASAEAEIRAGERLGAKLICHGTREYPELLAEITDAPPIIWALGDVGLLRRPAIAMVGTRRCSSIGERMARNLAGGLGAAGFVIVSGLARGIDAAVHDAALPTGTIAVVAGGLDIVYPPENRGLRERILQGGLLLSEQPPGLEPQARHFPPRNRIISGLARGLVVVEAAARSGSLITARNALDQGRDVLAVPGHPFDARVSGCNLLIRDGATLVRSPDDVIEALGPADQMPAPKQPLGRQPSGDRPRQPTEHRTARPQASPLKRPSDSAGALSLGRDILAALSMTPLAEDQLIRDLGKPASAVGPALTDLELEGAILRHPGGMISLSPEQASSRRH